MKRNFLETGDRFLVIAFDPFNSTIIHGPAKDVGEALRKAGESLYDSWDQAYEFHRWVDDEPRPENVTDDVRNYWIHHIGTQFPDAVLPVFVEKDDLPVSVPEPYASESFTAREYSLEGAA